MTRVRKILFLTATRADFGKLKPLIRRVGGSPDFQCALFVTGMHTMRRYGYTVDEVYSAVADRRLLDGTRNVYTFHNQVHGQPMEQVLANTIGGLSHYVSEFPPDMIVVHGDRVEALAGAIVGSLRNVLVAHVEGGEVSGTVDELMRHAVTKMSHIHFVANEVAARRLRQLGERENSIHVIGSPDIDLMLSDSLPTIDAVKDHYGIAYDDYAIVLFHPVTTDLAGTARDAGAIVDAIIASKLNFIVLYPNNDQGCQHIFDQYERLKPLGRIKLLPSMRVEAFFVLMKNARFLLGNSSAGIREAPVYGVPSLNVSSRQNGRFAADCILNVAGDKTILLDAMLNSRHVRTGYKPDLSFGTGRSTDLFMESIRSDGFWHTPHQKQFNDLSL